ncbi:MAG: protein kinase [Planctomycetaceae bacterium]|nr:protein kinase [Planctomycetaceae bacterium]
MRSIQGLRSGLENMGSKDCPPPDALDRWASGNLADDEADAIAEHLDTCTDCENTIADSGVAGLLSCVSEPATGTRFDQEMQCEAFVSALQNLTSQSRSAHSAWLDHDHWVGRRIRDYQLLRRLGQGAMGAVYEARHIRLNKNVAMKLLTEKLGDNPTAATRFQREMQAVGLFEHPNVVQALDAGEANGVSFLVMELIEGIDLAELTAGCSRLDIADACEITRQVAVGLQYAHSQGLVHRDVKPSNLMLTRDANGNPCVKILDLGLATIEGLDAHPHLTDDGQLMGTLEFMAPEQAEDTRAVDYRADLYSLGATFFRLLTGSVPFAGPEFDTPVKRLNALLHRSAPSVASRRDDLPQALVLLINRMLARLPDERPCDMAEVASQLENFAAGHELGRVLESERVNQRSSLVATFDASEAMLDTTPSQSETVELPFREQEVSVNPPRRTGLPVATASRFIRLLFGAAPIVALLLGTIWLQTDGGYIRIESDDPSIEVSVEILKARRLIDSVNVRASGGHFWYRSGSYEVRFPIGADDGFTLVGGDVTITRGTESVVTISRVASPLKEVTASGRPSESSALIVTTTEDGVDVRGSLRDAVSGAVKGDTIRFAPALAGKTITLNGSPLQVAEDITIDAENLKTAIAIDGAGLSRVFDLVKRRNLRIQGVSITGGKDYAPGGGITVEEATLSMRNCTISGCSAPTDGGGIYCVNGNIVLENCLVVDNSAGHLGGGIANYGGTCRLVNCVFTKNSSGREHGGAIVNVNAGTMELIHCTVSGNINSGVSSHRWSTLILESSIVTNNDQVDDGLKRDVWIQRMDGGGIVARGANIIENFGAAVKSGPDPIIAGAMLAPLGIYGGPFLTMPPLPGSPAIDAAIATDYTPAVDIRGTKRPLDGNGDGRLLPDIGAVEFDPAHDTTAQNDSSTRVLKANVPLPTRDLPDLAKLPAGKVQVFGTANQPLELGAAAEISDFVEVQIDSNRGWFGLRSNGDVYRWNIAHGAELYRRDQDVRVLNRTSDAAYGEWLSGVGSVIQRGHPDNVLIANAPEANIVDLARSYPTGDWTVLTNDGRLRYIGKTEFPPPNEITDFVRLGNWHDHHVGIRENGELLVWGRDPMPLPDLSEHQFAKVRSTEFYTLLLTTPGTLVHLTKEQIVELPEEFERDGWVDIACGNLIYAARQSDGYWRAWGDPLAAEVVARINSLGANVPSISMTKDAVVWIETE